MPSTKTTSDNQRERREDRHAARAFRNRNEDYHGSAGVPFLKWLDHRQTAGERQHMRPRTEMDRMGFSTWLAAEVLTSIEL